MDFLYSSHPLPPLLAQVLLSLASQSVAPRPAASPRNAVECRCSGPNPDSLNQKLRGWGQQLCFWQALQAMSLVYAGVPEPLMAVQPPCTCLLITQDQKLKGRDHPFLSPPASPGISTRQVLKTHLLVTEAKAALLPDQEGKHSGPACTSERVPTLHLNHLAFLLGCISHIYKSAFPKSSPRFLHSFQLRKPKTRCHDLASVFPAGERGGHFCMFLKFHPPSIVIIFWTIEWDCWFMLRSRRLQASFFSPLYLCRYNTIMFYSSLWIKNANSSDMQLRGSPPHLI